MATKEKWIELFEKVVGRKPSPEEFFKAKEVGFDLKQIKSIAGLEVTQLDSAKSESDSDAAPDSQVVNQVEVVTVPEDSVSIIQPIPAEQTIVMGSAATTLVQPKPVNKKKRLLFGLGALLILGLGAGYYYMDSVTGMDVAVDEFQTAVKSNDYDQVASLLSTDQDKWTKSEAKDFLQYLNSQGVDIEKELDSIEASGGKNTYNDQRGNKLLGLRESGRKLGIFPEYQVTSYPVEIVVKSSLTDLTIDETKIEANKEVSLGEFHFSNQEFRANGKTNSGDFETILQPNLYQAEENRILLSLSPIQKNLNLKLPVDQSLVKDIKVISSDKEIAKSLTGKVEVLDNQTLELKVTFKFEDQTYTTETSKVFVDPSIGEIPAELTMSAEEGKKIADAQAAKAAKEAEAKLEQETKAKIQTFMNEYIESMRSSISARTVYFDKYFDTSSSVYNTYVNYIEGGGVARAKINYQTTIDYTVTEVKKDGENYLVTVHNKFREVYLNGKSDTVEKNQVFNLRPNGDSFLIFGVSET
ncbi:TcaA second domain-containing protein [Streptococcus suis]|uniref:TcaA second domain-containing protein n=1 Tax=Streptococcus suis TaxID=1307 RepID=UPI001ABE3667|nr:hypothetical protein [Streptococcus suis]